MPSFDLVERLNDPARRLTVSDRQEAAVLITQLEAALRSVISTWESPGPMGTLYQMPRAIDYARSVLKGPAEQEGPHA